MNIVYKKCYLESQEKKQEKFYLFIYMFLQYSYKIYIKISINRLKIQKIKLKVMKTFDIIGGLIQYDKKHGMEYL